jgi:hypothetical protein
VADKAAIERIARNRDAISAKNILVALSPGTGLWPELDETEITRATAEVGDQYKFVMIKLLLVLIRSRDRLELKFHLRKPRQFKGRTQAVEGRIVLAIRFCSREMGRASDHHTFAEAPELRLCHNSQFADDHGNQFLECKRRVEDHRMFE